MHMYHPLIRVVLSSALGENPAGNIPVCVCVDWKGTLNCLGVISVSIDVLLLTVYYSSY